MVRSKAQEGHRVVMLPLQVLLAGQGVLVEPQTMAGLTRTMEAAKEGLEAVQQGLAWPVWAGVLVEKMRHL